MNCIQVACIKFVLIIFYFAVRRPGHVARAGDVHGGIWW